MPHELQPLRWSQGRLFLLDQTRLPASVHYLQPLSAASVIKAIRRLVVRGAPLIGIAGAFGLVLEARRHPERRHLRLAAEQLKTARPTAVNLMWSIERLERVLGDKAVPESRIASYLEREACAILTEEEARSRKIGALGSRLIRDGFTVMTICNAGRLAAPDMGTALAPVYAAEALGRSVTVYVPETRPLLQGARLTASELSRAGIKCIVLTDSMISTVMPAVDLILVGADRIAANGDFANKVGTYQMALLARVFRKPFFTAAPISTFDFAARSGAQIPIERRSPNELIFCGHRQIAPREVGFHNPAFDVTPARLLSGIITDQGILRPPLGPAIKALRKRIGRLSRQPAAIPD